MSASRRPRRFVLARIVRATVGVLVSGVFRTKVVGAGNVPRSGTVLAGNHVSYGDPVLLWCRAPRPVHFMAKAELWKSALVGWGLDHFWAFPVRRGSADRESLALASALLQDGELVGIFPGGSRSAAEGESHGGAAFLSIRNNVPVVPVGVSGTDRIKVPGSRGLRFPKVVISFGEPIDPASFSQGGRKERVEAMTAEIMRRIAEQVARAKEAAGR